MAQLQEEFAIEFIGNIEIVIDGTYTFYLISNDGSKLFIDDIVVVNFDGLHGTATKSGQIKLSKGTHKIKIEYFQAGGGKGLELLFESKEIEKQKISSEILFFNNDF